MSKIITNFEIKNLTKVEELLDSIFNGEAPPVEALAVNCVLANRKLETAFGNILNCLTLTENTFCIWDSNTNAYEMYNDRTMEDIAVDDNRYFIQIIK